jgi:hypothetical protein
MSGGFLKSGDFGDDLGDPPSEQVRAIEPKELVKLPPAPP